ncbi:hypothetical protein H632_c1902p0, partial [Helicosporidium sp. ATCC 50920]
MKLPHDFSCGALDLVSASERATDEPDDRIEWEKALYSSDVFRMYYMKILPCFKRCVHDWTECPFAHQQEKVRRRDPRVHTYTGVACPSMKNSGSCHMGVHCPFAHNMFEYWLHPTRYRTQLCSNGSSCRRATCFFAHRPEDLRIPDSKPYISPASLSAAAAAALAGSR